MRHKNAGPKHDEGESQKDFEDRVRSRMGAYGGELRYLGNHLQDDAISTGNTTCGMCKTKNVRGTLFCLAAERCTAPLTTAGLA